ncbi:MAG TPA: hydantoinase/oxoprolinase family protein [Nitrososphaerales archaeon]|nr:hydantoinase/oxoprolinase family protein [Nitrososphaerales archaeon]
MPRRSGGLTVGVDVGGTFTDVIVSGPDTLLVAKLPTSSDPAGAVLRGLKSLGVDCSRVSLVVHATTLATNALLTRKGLARSALVTNEGFRDVLEVGRQRRPELYDLGTRRPPPLIPRRDRLTLGCRQASDGTEVTPFDPTEARLLASKVVKGGYESVAVCFLNSYVDGTHEGMMRDALRERGFMGHISISSEVDREYREYERTSTTAVNAVLSPLMSGYLERLRASLSGAGVKAPVFIMNSDGGSSTLPFASSRPVNVIESGPAAGVVASKLLAKELSLDRVLTFDMGGTTAKAGAVLGGEPDITREFEAAGRVHSGRSVKGSGYAVRGSFIDLAEVSAGGGTVARLDEVGDLQVGPESAGSDPGPACYGRGGTDPTVTDANVLLGRVNPGHLLGGEMPIDHALSVRAFRRLSSKLHTTPEEAALGVLRIVNNRMARAISLVSVERGRDPRDFVLFAFGGGGPGHVCDLAEDLGVKDIVVPTHAGLFSAKGLLAGELTRTFTETVLKVEPDLKGSFRRLEAQAARTMNEEGLPDFSTTRSFEARYLGQSHELTLPFGGSSGIKRSFDEEHRSTYGFSTGDPVEVVTIRVKATVPRPAFATQPAASSTNLGPRRTRVAWVGGREGQVEVISRESLAPGDSGKGPCVIEEYDSTTVVNQSWSWTTEPYGTRLRR